MLSRYSNSLVAGLVALVSSTAALADDPAGTLVIVDSDEVFVPNGFDDNDETLAVLDGYLPSACHKLAFTETVKDPVTGATTILQYARKFDGICLQVRVPYTSEVSLGVMPAGTFKISAKGAAPQDLRVAEATNAGPDDHLYAPIDAVRVERDEATGSYAAVLDGRFTNRCMHFKEVNVINSGRTIEILPIIEMDETEADCGDDRDAPFSYRAALPEGMTAGRHLVHVRSLNGKSANAVFTAAPVAP
jgi:hypothetical protein